MFKIKLVKNEDILTSRNSDKYESKTVTGRIKKTCTICSKTIEPGEISVTNTRVHKSGDGKNKKYITYHTCVGRCSTIFAQQIFKL